MDKQNNFLAGTGLLTAVSASLCCITPVLALISGSSSMASSFSWLEPARPYLLGITVAVLAFAWYQKLKPVPKDDCGCAVDTKTPFLQSKLFLGIVTVLAVIMMTFPYYSSVFYSSNKSQVALEGVEQEVAKISTFQIEGMTCQGCEEHVSHAIMQLNGILDVRVSYEKGNAKVQFDTTLVSSNEIKAAIDSTGYKTISYQ